MLVILWILLCPTFDITDKLENLEKSQRNSATKKHIQCTFIERELLGFLWFEIILYKQRLIELFGSYVETRDNILHSNFNIHSSFLSQFSRQLIKRSLLIGWYYQPHYAHLLTFGTKSSIPAS
ncbi:hypothetical protein PROFUN_16398 [Planoprotostelium fungivorum]|uniref:Uncharacterized protein n=1 Tax=Planoprotostelium fungivorum TaxID=1890364 RepID=A0A2P6MQY4_9EUKA|nr:hypothetical protein PROFUN_16398 [Planoprotostelium fungivorum]